VTNTKGRDVVKKKKALGSPRGKCWRRHRQQKVSWKIGELKRQVQKAGKGGRLGGFLKEKGTTKLWKKKEEKGLTKKKRGKRGGRRPKK